MGLGKKLGGGIGLSNGGNVRLSGFFWRSGKTHKICVIPKRFQKIRVRGVNVRFSGFSRILK